jgi:hypothetical protein
MGHALDEAVVDWISTTDHDDRYSPCRVDDCSGCIGADRNNDVNTSLGKLSGKQWQLVERSSSIVPFDDQVAPHDIAKTGKGLDQGGGSPITRRE